MMNKDQIRNAAEALDTAEKDRCQVRATTLDYPDMTIEDAYAIQESWISMKLADGRTIKGHKIGLTSRAMQQSMQINEPDSGILLDDMIIEDGSDIVVADFLDPRIEVELAFVLGDRLEGEDVTIFDVLSATDYVVPALELIAARSHRVDPESGRPRTVRDTIADNAANAGIIIGGRPVKPLDTDLRWVGALLYRNGVIEETGVAAGVLNHPAKGIAWLARKYAPLGIALEAGQVILAGSFTRPVTCSAGDTFHADFGELGGISCRFI